MCLTTLKNNPMKRHPHFIFAFFIFCFSISISQAQVTGVKYRLVYNDTTSLHDVYIHIVSGTSISAFHRAQFPSSVSIVAKTGTHLDVANNYMPLKNNQFYNGTEPYDWRVTNFVSSPFSQPEDDFYYFSIPALNYYYNNLQVSDSVRLFSIDIINPAGDCKNSIRLYENGIDPDSSMPGMENSDFSNGILIGGGIQDYEGNFPQIKKKSLKLSSVRLIEDSTTISINIENGFSENCIYEWTTPNSTASTKNITIPRQPQSSGVYKLVITEGGSCLDTTYFNINIDNIKTVCNSEIISIYNNNYIGNWFSPQINPSGGMIVNDTLGIIQFNDKAKGIYNFWDEKSETFRTVEFIKVLNTSDDIVFNLPGNVCASSEPIPLNAMPVGGVFYGVGVSGNSTLDPSSLGNGLYDITYNFIDQDNCPASKTNIIEVFPEVTITYDTSEICVGDFIDVNVTPSSGKWRKLSGNGPTGWSSISPGRYTFFFYSNHTGKSTYEYSVDGCSDTIIFNVKPLPVVSISKDTVCVGLTSQAFPSTGGTWASSNSSIATLSNSGLIVALSPGTTTFTFVSSSTGCTSNPTEPFTVEAGPPIIYSGDSTLCIGETTNLLPSSGGTWAIAPSFSTTVASIAYNGSIVAQGAGFTRFVFTSASTGCKSEPSGSLTVNPKPTVFIDGPETICVGSTTQLFPSTGGSWQSNNNALATVNNSGIVTGVGIGSTSFVFTNTQTGCVSENTSNIIVNQPTIIFPDFQVCVGEHIIPFPSINGEWTSSNSSIATVSVTSIGLKINAKTEGKTIISNTNASGCNTFFELTVNPIPIVNIGGEEIIKVCNTTTLQSSEPGFWFSNNPDVATVTGNVVKGLSPGTASFSFGASSGCGANKLLTITVLEDKFSSFGLSNICIGRLMTLFPEFPGTIEALSDPSILVIVNNKEIHAKGAGIGILKFTTNEGCEYIDTLIVSPKPLINFTENNSICVNSTTIVSSDITTGTWTSSNTSVATIDNSGFVTGLSDGVAYLHFTNWLTGCGSDPLKLLVDAKPVISSKNNKTKIKGSIQFSTNAFYGKWNSSNKKVGTINSKGLLIGKSKGKTIITYEEFGCVSNEIEVEVTNLDIAKNELHTSGNNEFIIEEATAQRDRNDEIEKVNIYPNPASQYLHIQSNETISDVEIFDLTGKIILKSPSKNEIDISTLANGFYQIKIETEEGEITRKNFIKNN